MLDTLTQIFAVVFAIFAAAPFLAMLGILAISLLILVAVPFGASFQICVPKWWRQKVSPKLNPIRRRAWEFHDNLERQETATSRVTAAVLSGLLTALIIWPVTAFGWLINAWITKPVRWAFHKANDALDAYENAVKTFVQRRCPYSHYCPDHAIAHGDIPGRMVCLECGNEWRAAR